VESFIILLTSKLFERCLVRAPVVGLRFDGSYRICLVSGICVPYSCRFTPNVDQSIGWHITIFGTKGVQHNLFFLHPTIRQGRSFLEFSAYPVLQGHSHLSKCLFFPMVVLALLPSLVSQY